MTEALISDPIRTRIGRMNVSPSMIRVDLAAIAIRTLIDRSPGVAWAPPRDSILGCSQTI